VKVAFHMASAVPPHIPNPESLDRSVCEEEVGQIREVLAGRLPALNNEVVKTVTCMYTSTQDNNL
jgi:hypothetical protein